MKNKPIICVDFDGVVHSYDKGWQNGVIYGELVVGFWEWVERVIIDFRVVIYSSRSKDPIQLIKMKDWISDKYDEWTKDKFSVDGLLDLTLVEQLEYAQEKPPAFLTIDDRAIRFKGDWSAEELTVTSLQNFKPWNIK